MGLFSKLFGKTEAINPNHVYAPVAGNVVAISEVPDPTFSEGMMGNGVAIQPTDGKVCAPFNGTVDMMFDTGHAVSLVSESGIELLIHVGLETVGLNGAPFGQDKTFYLSISGSSLTFNFPDMAHNLVFTK